MMLEWGPFLIDVPSFLEWVTTTYGWPVNANSMSSGLMLVKKNSPQTEMTTEEVDGIKAHFLALDETAEATKRALPSRKMMKEKSDFEMAVKSFIATKDWASMSVAERKFAMGSQLTNAEYDTLTTA